MATASAALNAIDASRKNPSGITGSLHRQGISPRVTFRDSNVLIPVECGPVKTCAFQLLSGQHRDGRNPANVAGEDRQSLPQRSNQWLPAVGHAPDQQGCTPLADTTPQCSPRWMEGRCRQKILQALGRRRVTLLPPSLKSALVPDPFAGQSPAKRISGEAFIRVQDPQASRFTTNPLLALRSLREC